MGNFAHQEKSELGRNIAYRLLDNELKFAKKHKISNSVWR